MTYAQSEPRPRRAPTRHGCSLGRGRPTCVAVALVMLAAFPDRAAAQTLSDAFALAFESNPSLNALRAAVNVADESVPLAESGFLPRVDAVGEGGYHYQSQSSPAGGRTRSERSPYGYGVELTQPLFDGFRTRNAVGAAQSDVLGAREALRNSEQAIMFEVVRAYLGVVTDRKIRAINKDHVAALQKQLDLVRGRHDFGDVTKTDVLQVEARLQSARAQVNTAEAELQSSIAAFGQVVGTPPGALHFAGPVDGLVPPNRDAALQTALDQHPALIASLHGVEAAALQIGVIESGLLPSISLNSAATQNYETDIDGGRQFDVSVLARVRIPLYEGGEVRAGVRQAGHLRAQRQLESDSIRDQVRAAAIASWGQYQSSKARLLASQSQVTLARSALDGVQREYRGGDRDNYDVLNAQQDLLDAEITHAIALRDRTVASYAVVRAIGSLDFQALESSKIGALDLAGLSDGGPRTAVAEASVEAQPVLESAVAAAEPKSPAKTGHRKRVAKRDAGKNKAPSVKTPVTFRAAIIEDVAAPERTAQAGSPSSAPARVVLRQGLTDD